jgi:GntR family transcriptional repressor for pyruvate dehydrogenase complex
MPLSDRVVHGVVEAVQSGRHAPGTRLPTERALGERFGVSRSVIRDALRRLEAGGVVRVEHGRGIFVSDTVGHVTGNHLLGSLLAPGEIDRLFELRMAVEVAAAGLAAVRSAEGERLALVALADAALRLPSDALEALSEADVAFHEALTAATHNEVFIQVMANLLDLLAQSRRASLHLPGRPRTSAVEHARIAHYVADANPDGARAAMSWHLLSVEESLSGTPLADGQAARHGPAFLAAGTPTLRKHRKRG